MEYGLIGNPLGHSFSPRIHSFLGDYRYDLHPLPPEELEAFLKAGDFKGLNVTIPYKQAVMPYLSEVSPRARRIGSVNTIVRRSDGSLAGDNTDYAGFTYLARRAGVHLRGKKVLLLGTGGTSRTVQAVCADAGVRELVLVSRRGPVDYTAVYAHQDAQVVVNTTPVGMYPDTGERPLDLSRFPALEGVLDVIYNPLRTALLLQAEDLGLKRANGLAMLVAQAAEAAGRFTGRAPSFRRVGEITDLLTREYRNVVLIGMPGSGKTTVGRAVAELMGREFVDADVELERRAGRTIPEIFAREGEEAFRRMETEVLRELGQGTGRVIATGGGAILRPENRAALRQNGRIYWLRRRLDRLAVKGRPLSSQPGAVERLWRERAPLYEQYAQVALSNNGSRNKTAQRLVRDFQRSRG